MHAKRERPGGAAGNDGPLVLVVDDDVDILNLLELYLSSEGFRVTTAMDARSALLAVAEVEPDAILLDVMMPDTNGIDVVRRIRSDATRPDTPIILLSANADSEAVGQGLLAGANAYLTKPFDGDYV